ncbi:MULTISPECIES: magnesium-translocating P-type ATPase [Lacticaseibacillus]|uniref:Magnesium-transporting ATPase, P-type 1 n=2 Tax=Lacticaseibacillus TaxID=2759736 RepID=A0AAN1KEV9_LACCA|nr:MULTISPECIES: magnesium-translocating P-type ATPase [Lacticaseibacillus]ARY92213.1 magnesium-translocating P-type ATPase [Lacticaseibacillus casei]KAB1971263.1 magnesium-translocating P-type ATPase [Lacticaseibacillus casei]WLV80120.1 magnesium-translocating P-type ATPase [Lacticaseibacillus sp. NCIMB 15473]WNX24079.1 magnesium-translocating P-type ATPase [Lacticaseibacillus casei]WNX26853.1 magnesium-translocating P-type ATPase [Lacticaseibacillus casei]
MFKKTITRHNASTQEKTAALMQYSQHQPHEVLATLRTREAGLMPAEAADRLEETGSNTVVTQHPRPWYLILFAAFNEPFVWVLLLLCIVSIMTADYDGARMMGLMITLSVSIHFWQEYRSQKESHALAALIANTTAVTRDGQTQERPMDEVVPGDIVQLATGDMIPADAYLIATHDLFVNQSSFTGEAMPVEKTAGKATLDTDQSLFDAPNLVFMGTDVISGSGTAVILKTGDATYFGDMANQIGHKPAPTSFEQGMRAISRVLISMMLVLVPVVFVINGITKQDWSQAFFFAIAVAVGLTPEMLPMIVNSNLAKGALAMSKRKVIVKRLHAIQNLGAIDTLFTDKTGTITEDRVVVMRYVDATGATDPAVLRMAYMNANYQTGWHNLIDTAVVNYAHEHEAILADLPAGLTKIDEIPFDFERRRLTVVVANEDHQWMITKGAFEEMLAVCDRVELHGEVLPITPERLKQLQHTNAAMSGQGMRVIVVAYRQDVHQQEIYTTADEQHMVIAGFLGFLDPAKPDAKEAVGLLRNHGVRVKVLTGDNAIITQHVAEEVGIANQLVVTGNDVEAMDDKALQQAVESTDLFVKLSPLQKARIIKTMRAAGHTVGYMGDGINDTAALREADVSISVDTAADITKDASGIILLEKSLLVLEDGILEGRRVYANAMKYIKMTIASNFGNAFSVLVASIFLPFLPMLAIQLLVQNLIYDTSQMTIPWDNVDDATLAEPTPWRAKGLLRYTLTFGPLSSLFDITTFLFLWFGLGIGAHAASLPAQHVFQAGWFVVGLFTQSLVVHVLRTRVTPFWRSPASAIVILSTMLALLVGLFLILSPLHRAFDFAVLPLGYWPGAALIVLTYLIVVECVKRVYLKRGWPWL